MYATFCWQKEHGFFLNFFKAAADIFGATFFGFKVLLLLAPTVVLLSEGPVVVTGMVVSLIWILIS